MKIQFHGAVRDVTGSMHLLHVNGLKILLDCGLYQGKRQDTYTRNQNFPFNPADIDLLILSHAHIDHSGNIPNLVKHGFKGDIICTYATRDLCAVMLRDSAHIQEQDVEFVNRRRRRKGQAPVQPLYTKEDAMKSLTYFVGIGYKRPFRITDHIHLTFFDAGHILGSAIVALDIVDHETHMEKRLIFSGDLGRPDRPILRDPTLIQNADILIIESTYGDREHDPADESSKKLERIINETYHRKGKVIVPAFAVGRTQELVYRLHQLMEARDIPPDLLIYVDSPLAINTTNIYRIHPEGYDSETEAFFLTHGDPFGFERMRYTRTVTESKELNFLSQSAVIISASGMAEAGRILHHLKNNIEDPKNTILIVGWQAPHTLGRRIVEKSPTVRIFGDPYQLNAQVETINGFSAHAGRSELLAWADHIYPRPKHTFIVHGEETAATSLGEALKTELNYPDVQVPVLNQKFVV